MELHVQTRGNLQPDPAFDQIVCLFYSIHNDVPDDSKFLPQKAIGVFVVKNKKDDGSRPPRPVFRRVSNNTEITYFETEQSMLQGFIALVRKWDPDIFAGYEIEMASWGYMIQRGQMIGLSLIPLLSRVPSQKPEKPRDFNEEQPQEIDFELEYDSHIKLHGRILLDVWRLLRGEIALMSYTFENIMFHVLHRRYQLKSFNDLTNLWKSELTKWIVLEYYLERVEGTVQILNQLDLVGRTCELAKLFGIQFYEVLSRGSQFRVESMMLR